MAHVDLEKLGKGNFTMQINDYGFKGEMTVYRIGLIIDDKNQYSFSKIK